MAALRDRLLTTYEAYFVWEPHQEFGISKRGDLSYIDGCNLIILYKSCTSIVAQLTYRFHQRGKAALLLFEDGGRNSYKLNQYSYPKKVKIQKPQVIDY